MVDFFKTVTIIVLVYCVGAFPTGYFLALFFSNTDLRTFGSGTVGASNVSRLLGPIGFFFVFLFDLSKAYISLYLYSVFFPDEIIATIFLSLILVLGNIFSYGTSYPRGKGVSTALGSLLFFNIQLFLIFVVLWIGLVLFWKVPTYASVISSFIILVISFYSDSDFQTKFFLIVLHPILFYTHRIVLQKLLFNERVICYLRQLRKRLPLSKQ
jgi:glycerol-3-phosphate acyltransferase PlsY